MSITISAAPALLLFSIGGTFLVEAATAIKAGSASVMRKEEKLHLGDEVVEQIVKKEYKTQIMDKKTLLKTLSEHGAVNIREYGDNITCECENFHLDFNKSFNNPYKLKIKFNKNYGNVEEFVENIGSEYTMNAQEISYNKIKERLEEQNLEIEDEEIFDDNTIVLTVNLE